MSSAQPLHEMQGRGGGFPRGRGRGHPRGPRGRPRGPTSVLFLVFKKCSRFHIKYFQTMSLKNFV